ncbi:MAG: DUF4249 family protein [Saprospiraceae bacterium]|nr:DUF4249 family protein [Candidatus Brachybacter algidus]
MKNLIIFCLSLMTLVSCNLSKEVDINLTVYGSQPVVECYLIPGERYQLLLTKSNSFFDPLTIDNPAAYLESLLLKGADVKIIYNNDTIQLQETLTFNPDNGQISNYSAQEIVPDDSNSTFELLVTLADGSTITASTIIPTLVRIDSTKVEYANQNKTRATIFIYHQDNRNTLDFYRRMIHVSSLDSAAQQDYTTDDKINDTESVAYGTFYEREDKKSVVGDTLIFTLIHVTKEYNDFSSSKSNANSANGNPFGQPGQIKSNVSGISKPIGIFTGFKIRRDTLYMP